MLDKAADTALVKQLLLVYFSSEDVVKAAILVLACSLVVSTRMKQKRVSMSIGSSLSLILLGHAASTYFMLLLA